MCVQVDELFQELGTRLVYERSADPNAFLLQVLKDIQKNRSTSTPMPFFTEHDVSDGRMF